MTSHALIMKITGSPGSGKSRMLAREACRMVKTEGIAPERILLLGATPLQCRMLARYLEIEAEAAGLFQLGFSVRTFDAWLLSLLSTTGESRKPTLLSEREAAVLLHDIARRAAPAGSTLHSSIRHPGTARGLLEEIRRLRQYGVTPEDLARLPILEKAFTKNLPGEPAADSRPLLLARLDEAFLQCQRKAGLFLPVDLQKTVYDRLVADPGFRKTIADGYSAILADEAQDLSETQHRILAVSPCQLVLAGNEGLSIRSFRGARPEFFCTMAPYGDRPVKHHSLPGCMRGNDTVLALVETLLPVEPLEQSEQASDAASGDARRRESIGCAVEITTHPDPTAEAETVALRIEAFKRNSQIGAHAPTWSDCVVLLRSLHYRDYLIEAFLRHGIPFQCEQPPEDALRIKNATHALFGLFNMWTRLNLETLPDNAAALLTHLEALPCPSAEKRALIRESGQALVEWLEAVLPDGHTDALLQKIPPETMAMRADGESLWLFFQDAANLPEASARARAVLFRLYADFLANKCPITLLDGLCEVLTALPEFAHPDAPPVETVIRPFRETLNRLNSYYREALERPFTLSDVLLHFPQLWERADRGGADGASENAVRLLSFHQAQGEESPFVAIPFMVSGEFPRIRSGVAWLPPEVLSALGIDTSARAQAAEEARLLASGATRACRELHLSAHATDGGTPVAPSTFYTALLRSQDRFPALSGENTDRPVTLSRVDVRQKTESHMESDSSAVCTGTSPWAQLPRQSAEPVAINPEAWSLSASAIKTYMTCPLRFYYQNLLKLKTPEMSPSALAGTLFHRIMEVFNLGVGMLPHTAERLRTVADALFDLPTLANPQETNPKDASPEDSNAEEALQETAFDEKDRRMLERFGPLALSALREQFSAIIEDMERKGYFARYRNARRIEPEKRLDGIRLNGLDFRLSGSIDAVVEHADGTFEIVDYKSYRSAYLTGLETCEGHFLRVLDPLSEDDALSHAERFADRLKPAYPKDYQLPLYYLACAQNPAYRGKLRGCTLQILRPRFPDHPEQGAISLVLPAEALEAARETILNDLNRFVARPIRSAAPLPANPSPLVCPSCDYAGICESAPDNVSDGDWGGDEGEET